MLDRKVKIVTDSSSDLYDLGDFPFASAPLCIMTDEKSYVDNDELSVAGMVEDLEAYSGRSRTSCPNLGDWLAAFGDADEVYCITITSGLSGSYNSASSAALILREQFPQRKIYIVDSLGASSGYGLFMDLLADKRDAGMGIDDLYNWAMENRLKMNHWFFSTDLTFYVKGGRVSKASGFIGGVLNICPLLNMDERGCLIPRAKIRGKKKVIAEIVARMEQYADGGLDYDGKCYISHSHCYDDARAVADMVEARFPHLNGKVEIYYVGTTIGSHTGPGTVALFFMGRDRALPLL